MPDTSANDFLKGEGIPVDPRDIEDKLIQLWGPAAERMGGPELEHPTVTRVVLANLVVGSRLADAAPIDATLDTVVERYPCRAIVLRQTEEAARKVSAEVSALCHLPAPGMPQVCSERIVLRAGKTSLDLLPAAVRSLLEADLPFVLWWTYDPRDAEDIFLDLGDECSRLILDLPDPGAHVEALRLGLRLEKIPYARDIAWFGISRWRELVAQFFDGPCRTGLDQIAGVEIDAQAPDLSQPPRAAAWLAAWLAGQLGWNDESVQTASPGSLEATFHGPQGAIEVRVRTGIEPKMPFACLTGVRLRLRTSHGDVHYRAERPSGEAAEVHVEVDDPQACTLPRLVHARTYDAARRVHAALESARDDPPFRRALPHLLWLLQGSK